MAQTLLYLNRSEILLINRLMIQKFGGEYCQEKSNLLFPNEFDYLLSAVRGEISYYGDFSLFEKSSLLCVRIIQNHIFTDGNKRTGFEASNLFLRLNNYDLHFDTNSAIEVSLLIAKKELDYFDFSAWLEKRAEIVL